MSLKGIISISGMPGLYKVLAQTKSGFIVEALSDKKRMPIASTQRISMLEDISVFTTADELPLKEVMLKLIEHAEKNQMADPKSEPAQLRDFFKNIVPDYDAERVYPSDIKKIINWFQLVKDIVAIEDEPEVTAAAEAPAAETPAEEKPAKEQKKEKAPAKAKKKTAGEESSTDATATSAKPKKKTASK
jgi:hypothetical protein